MTVTSSTTAVAFFSNAFSPIMPIRAFGIFTGVLIPINFFLVVMIMPPAVIYYEFNIKNKYTKCFGCCKKDDLDQGENSEQAVEPEESKIEKFFDNTWNRMVHKFRYPIIALSLCWAGVTFVFATKMTPQTERERFLKDNHPL